MKPSGRRKQRKSVLFVAGWGSIEATSVKSLLRVHRIAIAGDLHGAWLAQDEALLMKLKPDGVLFVGDLSDGGLAVLKDILKISFPTLVILGNHDRGHDHTGELIKLQIKLLGEKDCSWKLGQWKLPGISVVGARPCSAGGGYYLSPEVVAAFGEVSLEESVDRIVNAANKAPVDVPMILLAHSGPSGLGSEASSLCGRDWKLPAIDWGDKDLMIAIHKIRKIKRPDLVVFGHTHHQLRRNLGNRNTFVRDIWGTCYLNAACVPRRGRDSHGEYLTHFSWVEFENDCLVHVSHRWFRNDASLAYEEKLFEI